MEDLLLQGLIAASRISKLLSTCFLDIAPGLPLPEFLPNFRAEPGWGKSVSIREHTMAKYKAKIWIDLDNSPHVPFFAPIIHELEARGYRVWVTASGRYQVSELATMHGIPHALFSTGYFGKNKLLKTIGIFQRAFLLLAPYRQERPDMAVSLGSRSQIITAKLAGIPVVVMIDYEYVKFPFIKFDCMIIPEAIPDSAISRSNCTRLWKYQGIKEDVYVPVFKPTSGILDQLGIDARRIVVTVRPPATEAHYHNVESEEVFSRVVERVSAHPCTVMVLLPRNMMQEQTIKGKWPDLIEKKEIIIPKNALFGLNLIWHSDLVISGGGTMNREAAALGVPVYSIFRGKIGAVDRYLVADNRLTLIECPDDVDWSVMLVKREHQESSAQSSNKTLHKIVDQLETVSSLAPFTKGKAKTIHGIKPFFRG